MKKVSLFLISLLILTGCSAVKSVKIAVTNPSEIDRANEMVHVEWNKVVEKLVLTGGETFVIRNESGAQVPYQIIYDGEATPQSVIFPASVLKGGTVNYTIEPGKPEEFAKKTFGRAVPERKDDFAWENDRIAFRMYGPALANENPSNGVDVWLKKTNDLIVDKFYKDDLENKISYHLDHGLGLDCYKVGHTLGAGGVAPFFNDSLWIGGHYSRAKLLYSGILRTAFELEYDSVPLDNKIITEKIIIYLDAYSQFSKAVVSYDGDFENFQVAGGIWLHSDQELGNMQSKPESGYIAYGENASDSKVPAGRTYLGVIFPDGMKTVDRRNDHLIGLADYKKGDQFIYYFGAGWSDWGFDTDDAWFEHVDKCAAQVKQPLQLVVQ
ncbi:MAG: DUF4861 domain-containing protein [Dysgonamonadaceae bacterium]|jgi:hypothetical protein|nr:DUF4861 domain-containing protein [Dysgonamonadaceae bacterium]